MAQTPTTSTLRHFIPSEDLLGNYEDAEIDIFFKLLKVLPTLETLSIAGGVLSGVTQDETIVQATLPSGMNTLSMHLENETNRFRSACCLTGGSQLTAIAQFEDEYLFTNGQSEVRIPRCWSSPLEVELPDFDSPFASVTLDAQKLKTFASILKADQIDLMMQAGILLCARTGDKYGTPYVFSPGYYQDVYLRNFDAAFRVFDLGLGSGHQLTVSLLREPDDVWCQCTWSFALGVTLTTYERAFSLREHHWKE